ncbi:non-canonical purine NTP pyrophosphatase [Paenibacillus beijingensis]|uniref:dITP/XTP pyrophosphatase n=1 Tax=Paenibacillus beijingensis TaxID=1126833 RepID=A0A0D5NLH7_9BACL|nr:non-canonical purine NTP pyrophosphatase [Paenibacillus beijingensis]AJY76010.1 purine NTP phosphatase [Paenibacillus beijingensis]
MMAGGSVIVVATGNAGKVREFAHAFAAYGKEVASIRDYSGIPDIVEDGDTFAANARIKAKTVGDALGLPALADDSGLCVDALGGAPGVYSARYAGEGAADADNNAKLLRELKKAAEAGGIVPEAADGLPSGVRALSTARFVCALAFYDPRSGAFTESEGTVSGLIIDRPLGEGGFGYDPLFWLPESGLTTAQLSTADKQRISHRGRALALLLKKLGSL